MGALYQHCLTLGVNFELGDGVAELLYAGSKCIGARTSAGRKYEAELTIVALGAGAAAVLPSLGQYQQAIGVPVLHLKVTDEEAELLRGIPVTYCRDLGFFFEPDPVSNLIKLCPTTGGYTHMVNGASIPPGRPQDYQFTPIDDEKRCRELVKQTMPGLADRPFVEKRFCWYMETLDQDYVIDFVPEKQGLMVVSGDSGHGFKMLPVVGGWVLEAIQAGKQSIDRWKWKTPGRDVVDLRVFNIRDLQDVAYLTKL